MLLTWPLPFASSFLTACIRHGWVVLCQLRDLHIIIQARLLLQITSNPSSASMFNHPPSITPHYAVSQVQVRSNEMPGKQVQVGGI